MLVISCECGQRMKGPPTLLGKTVKCVRCGEQVAVTKKNTTPLAPSGGSEPQGTKPAADEPATPKSPEKEAARHVGEILVEDGMLTAVQLREVFAVQEREGGQVLPIVLHLGYLDKQSLHDYLSRKPGIASIDLKSYFIPKELISLVPKEIAQECLVLPIDKLGRLLTVGMACPLDTSTIYRLEQITGLTVKPMLCKLDDILATIERYYPVEPSAVDRKIAVTKKTPRPQEPEAGGDQQETHAPQVAVQEITQPTPAPAAPVVPLRSEVVERFARMDALPTFTNTVDRVKERVDLGNATVRALVDVVAADPSIVAKLLSTANADPYGMPGSVLDANLAATLLGVDGVCEVAMLSVIAANQFDDPPLDFDRFLRRARFGASAAFALAALSVPAIRYQSRIGGLLHGIGSLALVCAFPHRAADLNDDVTPFERITDETRLFGVGHPEAGGILAEEWGIPKPIVDAIRFHRDHNAATTAGPVVCTVAFASILADAYMLDEPEPAHAIQEGEEHLKILGITARDALQIFNQVRTGIESGSVPGV